MDRSAGTAGPPIAGGAGGHAWRHQRYGRCRALGRV